jgi:hypothetical protein
MDDDPVLRSLGEDLERDDPALAALLSGRRTPRHRWSLAWLLLLLPLLVAALLMSVRVTLGVMTMLLVLASPAVVCWMCAAVDGPTSRYP